MSSQAITAWQAGDTGKGVKIGIVDSGINPSLAEFAGRIDPASGDVASTRPLADDDGHGTAVAATAAGARNDAFNLGVAFDATIIALRADDVGSCATTKGCAFFDDAIASGIDSARIAGAKVINLSMGGGAPGTLLLQAMGRAVNAGIVIVISAGNDATANPDSFALTAAQRYPGQIIIAGALDTSLTALASFSDQAGTGQAWYLTALGQSVRTVDNNGVSSNYSGTSFSAPIISGAVALLAQAFPNLTGQQIISLLFSSADDLGAVGNDIEFGYGRLNIAKAFQPVGKTTLGTSATVVNVGSSTGTLPGAAGDAAKTGSGLGVIILDQYSRAFAVNLAARLQSAERSFPLERALAGHVRSNGFAAGPIAVTLSVSEADHRAFATPERLGIGPDDARRARLVAGSIVAKLDPRTRAAFGISESAKELERKLSGASAGAFLIARDSSEPGFAARRGSAGALRREVGAGLGLTLSGEQGRVDRRIKIDNQVEAYRLASVGVDRAVGRRGWMSLSATKLDESRTVLGGRISDTIGGGGGSTTNFVDGEYRHDFGSGIGATIAARRGWTQFGGGNFSTAAYSFDLAKSGLLKVGDRLGLRLSQPLRVEHGGFAILLPTSYDYATSTAGETLSRYSLTPSGREIDAELGYSITLRRGWMGANLFARRQPGHIASEPTDMGGAIRYSLGF